VGPYSFLGKLPKLAVFPAKSGAENIASLGIVHQKRPLGVFPWDMIDCPHCMSKMPGI